MAKLHELIAVLGDRSTAAATILKETATTFQKRPDHFKGQTRTVGFFDEGRASENVTETKETVDSVEGKLEHTSRVVGKYWDALLQLEKTNGVASADLVVNGKKMAEGVPATWLLGMEARLKELRAVLLQVPTLAPELSWTPDAGAGAGTYVSAPQTNFKTEKRVNHKVLYEATKEHPAVIEKWNEDTPVAKIETVHRSTMLTPAAKSRMIARCDDLLRAVKQARQRANTMDVQNMKVADKLFDYIITDDK